jgi:hypothetical protein
VVHCRVGWGDIVVHGERACWHGDRRNTVRFVWPIVHLADLGQNNGRYHVWFVAIGPAYLCAAMAAEAIMRSKTGRYLS